MSRRRKVAIGVLVGVLLGLGVGYWRWYLPTRVAVDIGAGMLAKQICSCVFVAGRDAADCRADMFPVMDPIRVEVVRDPQRVRAWLPALGDRSASHREGMGCTLE